MIKQLTGHEARLSRSGYGSKYSAEPRHWSRTGSCIWSPAMTMSFALKRQDRRDLMETLVVDRPEEDERMLRLAKPRAGDG